MDKSAYDIPGADIAWCPGCGNFAILNTLKEAVAEMDIAPEALVTVSGIGQAAKLPHYLKSNFFNGLHGRGLGAAFAIKAANPARTVIYTSGDGCTYGEGGNHFIHAIRRNPDITVLAHNNMVYGLTKGQASPTTMRGMQTPVQVNGVILEPFNPIAVAVSLDASFVARANAGDREQTKEIVKKAIAHKGFALVDIFQPCVSFNRINTYQWFKEHTYYVDDGYDPSDRSAAFAKCIEEDPWPLGVIYVNYKPSYNDSIPAYQESLAPLYKRDLDMSKLAALIERQRH